MMETWKRIRERTFKYRIRICVTTSTAGSSDISAFQYTSIPFFFGFGVTVVSISNALYRWQNFLTLQFATSWNVDLRTYFFGLLFIFMCIVVLTKRATCVLILAVIKARGLVAIVKRNNDWENDERGFWVTVLPIVMLLFQIEFERFGVWVLISYIGCGRYNMPSTPKIWNFGVRPRYYLGRTLRRRHKQNNTT